MSYYSYCEDSFRAKKLEDNLRDKMQLEVFHCSDISKLKSPRGLEKIQTLFESEFSHEDYSALVEETTAIMNRVKKQCHLSVEQLSSMRTVVQKDIFHNREILGALVDIWVWIFLSLFPNASIANKDISFTSLVIIYRDKGKGLFNMSTSKRRTNLQL